MPENSNTKIVKVKKVDPVGLSFYGEEFRNKGFSRVGEMGDLIPAFKEFYYLERQKNANGTLPEMLQRFNREVAYPENMRFHPYPSQLRQWRRKWDRDILAKKELSIDDAMVMSERQIKQVIKTRAESGYLAPQDNEIEAGVKTLGGELLNDALQMLHEDQDLEEIYNTDQLIKRRNYIVNVFSYATRLVHGKAALLLKASEEKRNNAGFLMTLLAKASSGKMSDEEMNLLKTAYTPKENVTSQSA